MTSTNFCKNTAKAAFENNQQLMGFWLQLFDPVASEIIGLCGYDLVMIDMEHGLGSVQDAARIMRAVSGTGASSFVRLPSNDATILKTLMDQGVDGVMVPMIESAQEAQAVVSACRYPPKGSRGLAIGIARGSAYGTISDRDYVDNVADDTFVVCQIETLEGVRNAKDIIAVDGVDMLFVGRNDLAADSGHMLDLDHPEVNGLMDEVKAVAKAAGKKIGTVPSIGRSWQQLIDEGFDLVIPSSDIAVLRMFAQQEVGEFREKTRLAPLTTPIGKGY